MTSAIVSICFAFAIAHLLFLNVSKDAPMFTWRQENSARLAQERLLHANDGLFRQAADGGNLALHFAGFDPHDSTSARLVSQFYFRATYALYPRRVLVGSDDRIINNAEQLIETVERPDIAWLRSHDVRSVLRVHPSGEIEVTPVR